MSNSDHNCVYYDYPLVLIKFIVYDLIKINPLILFVNFKNWQ